MQAPPVPVQSPEQALDIPAFANVQALHGQKNPSPSKNATTKHTLSMSPESWRWYSGAEAAGETPRLLDSPYLAWRVGRVEQNTTISKTTTIH